MDQATQIALENEPTEVLTRTAITTQQCPASFWRALLSHLDVFVALAVIAVALCNRLLGSNPVNIPKFNMLDDSWVVDIAYRCARGNWLGKDVLFTYGPLYELMSGLPARLTGQSDFGFIYRTSAVIPIVVSILLIYSIGKLLLRSEPAWKRLTFFALVLWFWCPLDARPILVIFTLAVLVRFLDTLSSQTVYWRAALSSVLVFAGFLYSADTGIYSTATVFVVLGCAAVSAPSNRKNLLRFLGLFGGFSIVFVLALNAALGRLLDFQYFRAAMEQVSNYRWGQPIAMSEDIIRELAVLFCANALLGAFFIVVRVQQEAITRRPLFIASGSIVAFLFLQSGVVRADWGHVESAVLPEFLVLSLVLMGTGHATRLKNVLVTGATLAIAIAPSFWLKARPWQTASMRKNLTVERVSECPPTAGYFQGACLPFKQIEALQGARAFLSGSADGYSFTFPYQNAFAVSAGKLNAGGVLQTYAANGNYLTTLQLNSLERSRPERVVYGADDIVSGRIDEVSNFSRSPKIWFFLQKGYDFHSILPGDFAALNKNDDRLARWQETREPAMDFQKQEAVVTKPGSYVFSGASWATPYDFIRVQLRLKYPIWWRLSKPSQTAIAVQFSDGTVKVTRGIVPPNEVAELWVYPWQDQFLARYFLPDSSQWRVDNRVHNVARIAVLVAPYDVISVLPSTIEVQSVEAVRVGLN